MSIRERTTGDLRTVLDGLAARAALPFERAVSLSPDAYVSQALLELEEERLFRGDWVCPGRTADIPDAGDYITYSIASQPILIVRGTDGTIRAFANVCRHRMMRLVDGSGSCRRIVCPYHSWSYDLQGRLVGAPLADGLPEIDKSAFGLRELRVALWEGWIYVTSDADIAPPNEALAPLTAIVERFGMADYVPIHTEDKTWDTNWKIVAENFMESYHLPFAHGDTLGRDYPVGNTEFPADVPDAFTYSTFTLGETSDFGRAHPDNQRLEGVWRHRSVLPTIFPAHMIVLTPDYMRYLTLRPHGVGRTHVRYGVAVPPEVHASWRDREAEAARLCGLLDRVNEEDRVLVEGVYAGACAPDTESGPLHRYEREIHDFILYLARRLCDRVTTRTSA